MITAKPNSDQFLQYAVVTLNMPAGTPTVSPTPLQLQTGLTTLQKQAWAVSRIELELPPAILGSANFLKYSITLRSSGAIYMVDDLSNPAILYKRIIFNNIKTAVGIELDEAIVKTEFPDPMLILPQMLFFHVELKNAADLGAHQIITRIWYRNIEMKDSDFWDMVQLQQPISS